MSRGDDGADMSRYQWIGVSEHGARVPPPSLNSGRQRPGNIGSVGTRRAHAHGDVVPPLTTHDNERPTTDVSVFHGLWALKGRGRQGAGPQGRHSQETGSGHKMRFLFSLRPPLSVAFMPLSPFPMRHHCLERWGCSRGCDGGNGEGRRAGRYRGWSNRGWTA